MNPAYFVYGIVILVIAGFLISDAIYRSDCEKIGGRPVYEYRMSSSCWSADGRRIFP